MSLATTLRGLIEKATPGPWRKVENRSNHWGMVDVEGPGVSGYMLSGFTVTLDSNPRDYSRIHADADLIAALRNAAPALVALVEAVEACERDEVGSNPDDDREIVMSKSAWSKVIAALAALEAK